MGLSVSSKSRSLVVVGGSVYVADMGFLCV